MIRINLLASERSRAKKTGVGIPAAHRVTAIAAAILLLTVLALGWWYWDLRQQSMRVEREIARLELEAANLRSVLAQVQTFEARKAQLQQRVTLIEQLRKGQAAPARILDQISRSLPDRLWLADMAQLGNDFTLNGFATSMTALSDFVGGLEDTRWFRKPVEIIDSQVTSDAKTGDLIRFAIKASYIDPDAAPTPPKATAAPR
jgi:type IV pilus assembly protein PilN